jgi:hypothetical protein
MKGVNIMKYAIFILFAVILVFSTVYIYNTFTLKDKGKENLKVSFLFLLLSMPIAICICIITFLSLKCLGWILPVNISNYKIFIMSFASIFIIFSGESIIKMILSSMISSFFEKKYKNSNLSQNEMINLINEKHIAIEMLKMLSMFLISFIAYIIILKILSVENVIITCFIVSVVNSLIYIVMFKSK